MDESMCEAEEVSEAFIATDDEKAWNLLGEYVRNRRTQLNLSQEQAREFAGRSNAFWWKLEKGALRPRIYLSSAAGIERGLRWKEDSVKGILLHGWAPTPIEDSPNLEFILESINDLRREVAELSEAVDKVSSKEHLIGLIAEALQSFRA